ncbi:MAG TPA: hypothetical protein VGX91_08310 [Candidatus Cybelea sp.]|jgi:hypothetical protein|nr:hypothetical protein [Candidatus Cybelea sp.]
MDSTKIESLSKDVAAKHEALVVAQRRLDESFADAIKDPTHLISQAHLDALREWNSAFQAHSVAVVELLKLLSGFAVPGNEDPQSTR